VCVVAPFDVLQLGSLTNGGRGNAVAVSHHGHLG
jgi:hypothetical protein